VQGQGIIAQSLFGRNEGLGDLTIVLNMQGCLVNHD
jgi:hypothetical protein